MQYIKGLKCALCCLNKNTLYQQGVLKLYASYIDIFCITRANKQ